MVWTIFEAGDLLAVEPGDDMRKEFSGLGGQLRRALRERIPQSRGQFGRARGRVETRHVPAQAFAKDRAWRNSSSPASNMPVNAWLASRMWRAMARKVINSGVGR